MMSGDRGSDEGSGRRNEEPAAEDEHLEGEPIIPLTNARASPRAVRAGELARARAAAADERAFNELYTLFRGKIFNRIGRKVGAVPEREDLTQIVFMALHCALPQFRGEASLQTFLHQITTHVILDHLRRRQRRITAVEADDLDELPDEHPTPEALSGAREQLATVNALLPFVKPVHRMALQLVVLEGLSLSDAAARVGAKPHAVRQRLSKARREIAAMLDDARPTRSGKPGRSVSAPVRRRPQGTKAPASAPPRAEPLARGPRAEGALPAARTEALDEAAPDGD